MNSLKVVGLDRFETRAVANRSWPSIVPVIGAANCSPRLLPARRPDFLLVLAFKYRLASKIDSESQERKTSRRNRDPSFVGCQVCVDSNNVPKGGETRYRSMSTTAPPKRNIRRNAVRAVQHTPTCPAVRLNSAVSTSAGTVKDGLPKLRCRSTNKAVSF